MGTESGYLPCSIDAFSLPTFLSLLSFHSTCAGLPYFFSIFIERNTFKFDRLNHLPVPDQQGLSSSRHQAEKGHRVKCAFSVPSEPVHSTRL